MSDPLFSVIIPTYERPTFLAEALNSLLGQAGRDLEILVVDDASPGPVRLDGDDRVRVVRRTRNGGPAAARNTGLDACRGRYILFLDDDDLYTPERLTLAREGIARGPFTHCWMSYVHAPAGRNRSLEGNVRSEVLEGLTPHLGTVTVERRIALPFDERFLAGEDVEWWLRMAQIARVSAIPRVGYLLRKHGHWRLHLDLPARIRSRRLLLEVHAGYFALHPHAAAFQWKRIGLMALRLRERGLAREAFARSLRLRPQAATLWHLARAAGKRRPPPRRPEASADELPLDAPQDAMEELLP